MSPFSWRRHRQIGRLKVSLRSTLHFIEQLVKNFVDLNKDNRHKYISGNGKYIYHVAIIDYLQEYNLEKKAENLLKVWVYNREEYRISAVNQTMYRERF